MSSIIFNNIETEQRNKFKAECARRGISMRKAFIEWLESFTKGGQEKSQHEKMLHEKMLEEIRQKIEFH